MRESSLITMGSQLISGNNTECLTKKKYEHSPIKIIKSYYRNCKKHHPIQSRGTLFCLKFCCFPYPNQCPKFRGLFLQLGQIFKLSMKFKKLYMQCQSIIMPTVHITS